MWRPASVENKVVDQRNAQRPALLALMQSESIAEGARAEEAKENTKVRHIECPKCAPTVRRGQESGKQAYRACEKSGCCQQALPNPDTGEFKWCIQHGGGRRCKGADEAEGCPLGMSIADPTDKRAIYYDGLCVRCFSSAFPNDLRSVNAKRWFNAREQEVVKVLTSGLPGPCMDPRQRVRKGSPPATRHENQRSAPPHCDRRS